MEMYISKETGSIYRLSDNGRLEVAPINKDNSITDEWIPVNKEVIAIGNRELCEDIEKLLRRNRRTMLYNTITEDMEPYCVTEDRRSALELRLHPAYQSVVQEIIDEIDKGDRS